VLNRGQGSFAVVRTGATWFVVKQAPAQVAEHITRHAGDLRYDEGLVALKLRSPDGRWQDVLRVRPRTFKRWDGAGPLLYRGGRVGRPVGTRIAVSPDGGVTILGGFRDRAGGWLRRGVDFRFEPVGCGVRMSWPTRAGDLVVYSVFFRRRPSVLRDGKLLEGDGQAVTSSSRMRVSLLGGYSSGDDPSLLRARLARYSSRDDRVSLTICGQQPLERPAQEISTTRRPGLGADPVRARRGTSLRGRGAAESWRVMGR
jgi:hypothetical protein